ncbi:unnamed protein product [Leptosia nina]|uniref:Uncharacterized protein n=1 Tax=Leptosia nina TaxID=320188 RepID=A0AAV1JL77_9NEOP
MVRNTPRSETSEGGRLPPGVSTTVPKISITRARIRGDCSSNRSEIDTTRRSFRSTDTCASREFQRATARPSAGRVARRPQLVADGDVRYDRYGWRAQTCFRSTSRRKIRARMITPIWYQPRKTRESEDYRDIALGKRLSFIIREHASHRAAYIYFKGHSQHHIKIILQPRGRALT